MDRLLPSAFLTAGMAAGKGCDKLPQASAIATSAILAGCAFCAGCMAGGWTELRHTSHAPSGDLPQKMPWRIRASRSALQADQNVPLAGATCTWHLRPLAFSRSTGAWLNTSPASRLSIEFTFPFLDYVKLIRHTSTVLVKVWAVLDSELSALKAMSSAWILGTPSLVSTSSVPWLPSP